MNNSTEIFNLPQSAVKMALSTVTDTSSIFDEDSRVGLNEAQVPGYEGVYKYVPWGPYNSLPYIIIDKIGRDEIMSQNMCFNVLSTYGAGLRYTDVMTGNPAGGEIGRFALYNNLKRFSLEQTTDMKFFFFSVAVIVLNKEGDKILQVRHKEAEHCRFEKADKKGRINHVFYANWKKNTITRKDIEVLQLLDEHNPLGHLEVLMGKAPGADGECRKRTNARKFAILMKFPTPGNRYYPIPYYASVFRGDWYDIKQLIGKGKKSKIKNHASVKYHVEIDDRYWDNICNDEGILDPAERKKRITKEKQNIADFVSGIENSGKLWITGCYTSPDGKEQHYVRINVIDTSKEGGDWAEDILEASNMLCYSCNIHPNLVGATPGKSQTNNSGSDKRELFTLKQSIETAPRDILSAVHDVVIYFNGWEDRVRADVPLILLTTLDQHTDAKKITPNT